MRPFGACAAAAALLVLVTCAGHVSASCASYCGDLLTNCAGTGTSSYPIPFGTGDPSICTAVCALYPDTGIGGDLVGNTLSCRETWATDAAAHPSTSCVKAGPSGGGACGTTCDAYCNVIMSSAATAFFGGVVAYPSLEECLDVCSRFANDATTASSIQTNPPIAMGNSVQCRQYQATVGAYGSTFESHFGYGLLIPTGPVCVNNVNISPKASTYCDALATVGCTGLYGPVSNTSRFHCEAVADTFSDTVDAGVNYSTDTAWCRIYNMLATSVSKCQAASITSLGYCGNSACENFCPFAMATCTGDLAIYADNDACVSWCITYPLGTFANIAFNATTGNENSIGCREHYIAVSADNPSAAALYCSRASPWTDNFCGTPCDSYCTAQEATGFCEFGTPGALNIQYASSAQCQAVCPAFAVGNFSTTALGAGNGDDLACRHYYTGVAIQTPLTAAARCVDSGPAGGDGDDVCGTMCDAYCTLVMSGCLDANAQYLNTTHCMSVCAEFAADGAFGDTSGNTLQCRITYATVALANLAMDDDIANCPRAGFASIQCAGAAGYCDGYCDVMMATCAGGGSQFTSTAQCVDVCISFPAGDATDTTGNTFGCRLHHLNLASQPGGDTIANCPRAGLLGGGVCGAPYEAYCYYNNYACNNQWSTVNECLAAAVDIPTGTSVLTDTSGVNTITCRVISTLIASAAYAAAQTATGDLRCTYSGFDGGDFCGSWEENYCFWENSVCIGIDRQYGSTSLCTNVATAWANDTAPGSISISDTGDNLGCRFGQLRQAAAASSDLVAIRSGCINSGVASSLCEAGNLACDGFCSLTQRTCGTIAYADNGACETACAGFIAGSRFDVSGDTMGCRVYHLTVAITNATGYCPHLSSAPVTGCTAASLAPLKCDEFCQRVFDTCSTSAASADLYNNLQDCYVQCSGWVTGDVTQATFPSTNQDTLACRAYHLTVAEQSGVLADAQCARTYQQTELQCGTYCENMCGAIQVGCTFNDTQYINKTACVAACATQDSSSTGAADDSQWCRNNQATLVLANTIFSSDYVHVHCPYTGLAGGGLCGSRCDSYCRIVMATCTGLNHQYTDATQCSHICGAFEELDGGAITPYRGTIDRVIPSSEYAANTLACRLYHANVAAVALAASDAATVALHCPYAGALGGGQCPLGGLGPLESFCAILAGDNPDGVCVGANQQYDNYTACVTAGSGFDFLTGSPGDTRGDTFACRAYHASVAAVDSDSAITNCPYTAAEAVCVCVDQCVSFCEEQIATCGFAQYANTTECHAICKTWLVGNLVVDTGSGNITGPTLGATSACREYHTFVASTSPAAATQQCPHTGLDDAAGTCGTRCQGYCDLMIRGCEANGSPQYDDMNDCLTQCATFAADGNHGDTTGDTLQCRIHYATVAIVNGGQAPNCSYAAAVSTPCVNDPDFTCAHFCSIMNSTCTGANRQYADVAACLARCSSWSVGAVDDRGISTLGCRLYYAGAARDGNATAKHLYCPHAGIDDDTGSQCGTRCASFCDLAVFTCTEAYGTPPYATKLACVSSCANFSTLGGIGDSGGNTLQCRQYHLDVAVDANLTAVKILNCPYTAPVSDLCFDAMADCNPVCVHGNCTAPDTCECDSQWMGDLCGAPVCQEGCVNGNCTAPNTCECDNGWAGGNCSLAIVSSSSSSSSSTGRSSSSTAHASSSTAHSSSWTSSSSSTAHHSTTSSSSGGGNSSSGGGNSSNSSSSSSGGDDSSSSSGDGDGDLSSSSSALGDVNATVVIVVVVGTSLTTGQIAIITVAVVFVIAVLVSAVATGVTSAIGAGGSIGSTAAQSVRVITQFGDYGV